VQLISSPVAGAGHLAAAACPCAATNSTWTLLAAATSASQFPISITGVSAKVCKSEDALAGNRGPGDGLGAQGQHGSTPPSALTPCSRLGAQRAVARLKPTLTASGSNASSLARPAGTARYGARTATGPALVLLSPLWALTSPVVGARGDVSTTWKTTLRRTMD